MSVPPQAIAEWRDVDPATFEREIVTQYRPAVLRGLVAKWPVVERALESPESACRYIASFDQGAAVDVIRTPPSAKGRIFYNERMDGFNFTRDRNPLSAVIERMAKYAALTNPPAVAVQSAPVAECIPGFAAGHRLPILDASIQPRIWMGNEVVTPAHFDESNNVACVVAGTRRFTLLPPEQISNLYIGPLDFAPTGTPISLVSFRDPDFQRFPRFREALSAALVAELGPGDAIYIPTLWWHHVESLAKFNVLINYWWKGAAGAPAHPHSALDCLYHCLLNFKHLAPEHKRAWAAIFEHYVFNAEVDPSEHIPEGRKGVLGEISPELAKQVREFLVKQLTK